jgi:hypothetical protein
MSGNVIVGAFSGIAGMALFVTAFRAVKSGIHLPGSRPLFPLHLTIFAGLAGVFVSSICFLYVITPQERTEVVRFMSNLMLIIFGEVGLFSLFLSAMCVSCGMDTEKIKTGAILFGALSLVCVPGFAVTVWWIADPILRSKLYLIMFLCIATAVASGAVMGRYGGVLK